MENIEKGSLIKLKLGKPPLLVVLVFQTTTHAIHPPSSASSSSPNKNRFIIVSIFVYLCGAHRDAEMDFRGSREKSTNGN